MVTSSAHDHPLKDSIIAWLDQRQAVLVSHYYTSEACQQLTEQTGGFIGDSLAMARFGKAHPARCLVVLGVRFMGETAKILSPEKTVLMPTLDATCSLDIGCPAAEFIAWREAHPDRCAVVYANTSAAVKASADWVVTSSNAVSIVSYLHQQGKKICWAPDKHLGQYIQKNTGADMIIWPGACVVHEEYQQAQVMQLKQAYPDAAVLVHPESPDSVIACADVVGSTSVLLNASQSMSQQQFIVATEVGIFYKMQQQAPDKQFIPVLGQQANASCRACGSCPWMAMNDLEQVLEVLVQQHQEITIDAALIARAQQPLERMLAFQA